MKNLSDTLFKVRSCRQMPACGAVLVSEPFLTETYFNHSIISIIDYSREEGATGAVLNNRSECMLAELFSDVRIRFNIPVYCGGPMGQDRLFFIHTLGSEIIPGAREYAPGLFIGGDFDAIVEYVNDGYPTDGVVRFLVGYSSWTVGQLENELREGSWAIADNDAISPEELLNGNGDRQWHAAVRTLGEDYRSWRMLPRNAECN